MKEFNVTYAFEINGPALMEYIKSSPFPLQGIRIRDRNVTVIPISEQTTAEHDLTLQYMQEFDNFCQAVADVETIGKTKRWGRIMIDKFEFKNMERKRLGLMGRVELKNIMEEAQDDSVMLCLMEGSLDTLHGLLYGFPEEIVGENTVAAEAPCVFTYVWAEDIDWIKTELNTFLVTL